MPDSERNTAAERARGRSAAYWVLAGFFGGPPEAGALEFLVAGDGSEPTPSLAPLLVAVSGASPDALIRELAPEYVRLFGGIREGDGLAPPYESVHREGRLVGESTVAVIAAYRSSGYADIDKSLGPQDHLAAEMKFLAFLCLREAVAWVNREPEEVTAALEAQRQFLDEHLLRWVPAYCERLIAASRHPFYRALGTFTGKACVEERELVEELLGSAQTLSA